MRAKKMKNSKAPKSEPKDISLENKKDTESKDTESRNLETYENQNSGVIEGGSDFTRKEPASEARDATTEKAERGFEV